ncbi:MAG: DinB family protein [Candidatus Bathyarchaeia archaeon]|jgi:uncharacterized damage-inducible protein DinB
MDEVKLLYDQIETTFRGKSWHGPNMIQVLEGVSVDKARLRPLSGRHSIWELVNHMNYWMLAALKGLNGGEVPRPEGFEDWPPIGVTSEEWRTSVADLEGTVNSILDTLMGFSNARLEEKVQGRDYSYRSLIHGVLHHNLYHMGQIALLR